MSIRPTMTIWNVLMKDLCEDILTLEKRASFLSVLLDSQITRKVFVSKILQYEPFSESFVGMINTITEKYYWTYYDWNKWYVIYCNFLNCVGLQINFIHMMSIIIVLISKAFVVIRYEILSKKWFASWRVLFVPKS